MSNETRYQGERMSFYKLFTHDDFRIEIPKIQRDYAQGRVKEETVRTKFLSALFTYLEEEEPNRDLDFIYGNVRTENKGSKTFIPLDGQQRLTTLFLLHWYLAHIAEKIEHLHDFLRDNDHSRFTYETRSSSREFCNALMTENFNWDNDARVSEWIRNQGWYFTFWDSDPTVSSMLKMIDEIHKKFKGRQDFYHLLVNENEPVITFQFLNLEEFNLTDDLYIKMNSRGKPLTAFENFKAKFEGNIKDIFKDNPKTYKANWLENREVSVSDYFSFKIDTEWLSHFWKLSKSSPKKVDGYLMNFIRTILTAWYASNDSTSNCSISQKVDDKSLFLQVLLGTKRIDGQNKDEDLDFYIYEKIGSVTADSVTELIAAFDAIVNFNQDDRKLISEYQFDLIKIQRKVVEGSVTNQERLLFHAFIQYLIHHFHDLPSIGKWMRVVFNLVENTRVEFEQLEGGFEELTKLTHHAPNILEHLCQSETKISSFYSQQVIEEKIKSHLILKHPEWADLVKYLEGNSFNRGQIGYLLEFSGIWEFFKRNKNCNFSEGQNEEYFKSLKDYGAKAWAVLPILHDDPNNSNLWERAVLSKGDYLIPTSANRFNFLNSTTNLRDYSWKRLLRLNLNTDNHRDILASKRYLVKDVFDDKRFDVDKPWRSFEKIIEDSAVDWRSYFIEEPNLIKNCDEGFIRYDSPEQIRILRKKQLNSYHFELYTYAFFYKYLKYKVFEPIGTFEYQMGYGWEYPCYAFSQEWIWKDQSHNFRIHFNSTSHFTLVFSKIEKHKTEEYTDNISELLLQLNFEFNLNEKEFFYFSNNEESLFKQLQCLCLELKKLSE